MPNSTNLRQVLTVAQMQAAEQQLIDAGKPVVLITNTPYCIKEVGGCIPGAPTVIVNMNLTPEGLRTAKKVLFQELEPKGKWPITNYDPFGLKGKA